MKTYHQSDIHAYVGGV